MNRKSYAQKSTKMVAQCQIFGEGCALLLQGVQAADTNALTNIHRVPKLSYFCRG